MNDLFQQYFPRATNYFDSQAQPGTLDASSGSVSQGNLNYQVTPSNLPPPSEPNYSELTDQYGLVPSRFNTKQSTQGIDRLIDTTRVATGQQAQNAATAYSNRLTQQGQNPVASGVVQAQVQNAGNAQVKDLTVQRDSMRLAAQKDAALVASGIAEKIAQIRSQYSQTLADYNARQATLSMSAQQSNASNALSAAELSLRKKQLDAQTAASLRGAAPQTATPDSIGADAWGFDPGYITNTGPLVGATVNGAKQFNRVYTGY